ncbi:DNA-binding response regulator [Bifidobacterium hapali]|uniref:DNA-binding response regulator n=2 Tax=Bifidobacterium hapali TaxID=1630172 RepID=A0A261FZN9_9BIFI|nr:DNA-binding response regulator [Bifidobacterium hapali]
MEQSQPTVAIVDNDRFTRQALKQIIEQDGRYSVIWDRSDADVAQRLVMQPQTRPDVLLLDMSLTDTTGVDVCRAIRSKLSDIRILGITAFPPSQYAADLAAAGAQGLVTKDANAELLAGIRAVADNQTYCPTMPSVRFRTPIDAFRMVNDFATSSNANTDAATLSEREQAVLRSYARTGSYKITAKALGISDSTARNTMAHAKAKLGAASTAAAIIAWQERFGRQ